ncbi:MAG: ABC transporter permease, partial [Propionibacteriaceae bacterium]|nr:ABC transporter permease [Propionibacteriaceae bacterium]
MNIQPTHPRPSFWNTVGIVAKREIVVRFLSKSFLISTFITMAVFLALMVFAPQLGKLMTGDSTVAASGQIATTLEKIPDLTVKEVADDAAARELAASGEVTAAVVADSTNLTGMKVVVEKDLPTSLLNALSVTPEVEILNPNAPHPGILYVLRLGFGMVWMMAAITFGMSIAQSVV